MPQSAWAFVTTTESGPDKRGIGNLKYWDWT